MLPWAASSCPRRDRHDSRHWLDPGSYRCSLQETHTHAIAAPTPPQSQLTWLELRNPLVTDALMLQWEGHSVSCWHRLQRYRRCAIDPRKLSTMAPIQPAAVR